MIGFSVLPARISCQLGQNLWNATCCRHGVILLFFSSVNWTIYPVSNATTGHTNASFISILSRWQVWMENGPCLVPRRWLVCFCRGRKEDRELWNFVASYSLGGEIPALIGWSLIVFLFFLCLFAESELCCKFINSKSCFLHIFWFVWCYLKM